MLDLSGATITEGRRIQVWTDNGSSAQKWLLVPVEEAAAPETTKDLAVDDGGVLRLAGLLPGSYTLRETQAPGGYQKLSQPISFRVGAGGTITLADGTITETAHDGFAVTFKSGETLLSSGDSYTFKMTADAAITAFNAAGYALPGTGGGALWLQLAGAALVLLTLPAYNWIKTKKQKAKGRTRP